jgi:hypothetical protein
LRSRHFLKKDNFRLILGLKREATQFWAIEAEAAGLAYFSAIAQHVPRFGIPWYDRLAVFAPQVQLVLRALLIRRDDYLSHLKAIRSQDGKAVDETFIAEIENVAPTTLWMIEASAPELFPSSRRKFGEVVLAAHLTVPDHLRRAGKQVGRFGSYVWHGYCFSIRSLRSRILSSHRDVISD